jgi:hypothetical protein
MVYFGLRGLSWEPEGEVKLLIQTHQHANTNLEM